MLLSIIDIDSCIYNTTNDDNDNDIIIIIVIITFIIHTIITYNYYYYHYYYYYYYYLSMADCYAKVAEVLDCQYRCRLPHGSGALRQRPKLGKETIPVVASHCQDLCCGELRFRDPRSAVQSADGSSGSLSLERPGGGNGSEPCPSRLDSLARADADGFFYPAFPATQVQHGPQEAPASQGRIVNST